MITWDSIGEGLGFIGLTTRIGDPDDLLNQLEDLETRSDYVPAILRVTCSFQHRTMKEEFGWDIATFNELPPKKVPDIMTVDQADAYRSLAHIYRTVDCERTTGRTDALEKTCADCLKYYRDPENLGVLKGVELLPS